jgi:hypothetical protein
LAEDTLRRQIQIRIQDRDLAAAESRGIMHRPGVRQKGLDNMKQISTGAGLVALSVGMVATAFIATHRGSGEAFAQVTGGERRIVSAGVVPVNSWIVAYRIWSDNAVDLRNLGVAAETNTPGNGFIRWPQWQWFTADNGTTGFRPLTDVDMDGEVSSGDISNVLLDMGTRSADVPPPPIDCTINAPR